MLRTVLCDARRAALYSTGTVPGAVPKAALQSSLFVEGGSINIIDVPRSEIFLEKWDAAMRKTREGALAYLHAPCRCLVFEIALFCAVPGVYGYRKPNRCFKNIYSPSPLYCV
jgi:hypothetical protein